MGQAAVQQGEEEDQGAARQGPEPGVGEDLGVEVAGAVGDSAEKDGQHGAQGAQHHHLEEGEGGERGQAGDGVGGGGDAQPAGQQEAGEGGEEGRDQGGVLHDAHVDHLQGEDGGGEGGAEEGGEGGGHAADGDDAALFGLQAQFVADLAGDGGAQLEGGALPAGGAAHQVGEDGGEEDEGGGAQAHGLMLPDGHQHQVGALVLLHAAHLVEEHDGQAAQGEEEEQPVVLLAQLSGQVDAVVEGHTHGAHQQADEDGEEGAAEKIAQLVGQGTQGSGKGLHLSSSPEKALSYGKRQEKVRTVYHIPALS